MQREAAADKARAAGDQNAFGRTHLRDAGGMDFVKNFLEAVAKFPIRIMRLEFPHVADPPNVVADAIILDVSPFQFFAADAFALVNCFEHGTVPVSYTHLRAHET